MSQKPRFAGLLAAICAVVGLASSYVTGQFFILGLQKLEADEIARAALTASGVLMIAVELIAFGLAALLPRSALRGLRFKLILIGCLLLAFEGVTIYATQSALNAVANNDTIAKQNKAQSLKQSIESQRAAIAGLRAAGEKQTGSANAWAQHLGTVALQDAIKAEQQLSATSAELVSVQSSIAPNFSSVFSEGAMMAYSVARALLVSIMGLVMFGAAGALLRATPTPVKDVPKDFGASTLEGGLQNLMDTPREPSYTRNAAPIRFAGTAFLALSTLTSPVAYAVSAPAPTPAPTPDAGNAQDARYLRAVAAIESKQIKPTVRGVMSIERVSTRTATKWLARMGTEKRLKREKTGNLWTLSV